jgi:hypothetical protein
MTRRKEESPSREITAISAPQDTGRVAQAILDFVSRIPPSEVPHDRDPENESRKIANSAAQRAALTAGSLALPPGPLGWLTVLPELVAIWKIQGQMVSDIAAAYGKTPVLGREQMLWCLFRHTAAQAFRDVAIRVGDRLIFRSAAGSALQRLAQRIGVSVSRRALGKGLSRWLPVIGALGVGAYAYYDTGQVAKTAIDLFSGDVEVDGDGAPAKKAVSTRKTAATKKAVKSAVGKATTKAVRKTGTVKKAATRKVAATKAAVKKTTARKTSGRPAS